MRIVIVSSLLYEIEALYEWLCDHAVPMSVREVCPSLKGFFDFSHMFIYHKHNDHMRMHSVQKHMNSPRIQWFSYDTGKAMLSVGVLVTGIGKTASSSAVGAVSACINASFIITGCVLGVSPFLRFLDTILFTNASQYDIDCRKFSKYYGTMPDSDSHHVISQKQNVFTLLNTALQHVVKHTKAHDMSYYNNGYILTGDTFIPVDNKRTLPDGVTTLIQSYVNDSGMVHSDNDTDKNILYDRHTHPIAVDMETAAALYAARRFNNSAEAFGLVLDCMSDIDSLDFHHAIRTVALHIKEYIVTFLNTLSLS